VSEKDELYGEHEDSLITDGGEKLTVKRKRISVPAEEDISAISMLTAEDFIIKDDGKQATTDNESASGDDEVKSIEDAHDTDRYEKDEDTVSEENDGDTDIGDYSSLSPSGSEAGAELIESVEELEAFEEPSDDEELEFTSTNIFDEESATLDSEESDAANEQTEEAESTEPDEQFYLLDGDEGEEPVVTLTKKKRHSYNPDKPRRIDTAFDFLEIFVFSLVAVLIFTTFFFRHTIVEGPSMEQTLYGGEHLIITNVFYTPQRGDIIVCEDFATGHHKPIVKRVIAVAGDEVEILPTCIKVNDEIIPEPYVYTDDYDGFYTNDSSFCRKLTVGEGEIFVAGDHRNNSDDSRKFGPVRSDSVLGKVVLRFFPFDRFGIVK
jgi:signal peptidase I